MANPTSNFNWQMPTNTDLVKDLPADFEVFGQAVDTSLADLKGGTSGQILSKNSNTDMDFVWINNDQGDITAVNVTAPITGGGSAGAVTVGIQDGTTAQKGAVQLENSTSSTSTTTAAVPASVKSAYDLANAAIPKSIVDAAGDILYATANDTVARLGIGTAGQVLKVNSGATAPEWGAASAGASFSGVAARKEATISNNTVTSLSFDTEYFDTDGYHSNTTNPTRFTVPSGKAGYYQLTIIGEWQSNGSGQRRIEYWVNGSSKVGTLNIPALSGALGMCASFTTDSLTVGDYVEVKVFQSSGGNLDFYMFADGQKFSMVYLGA